MLRNEGADFQLKLIQANLAFGLLALFLNLILLLGKLGAAWDTAKTKQ
jgi:hypothetical protein